jgi:hypothetical protein
MFRQYELEQGVFFGLVIAIVLLTLAVQRAVGNRRETRAKEESDSDPVVH